MKNIHHGWKKKLRENCIIALDLLGREKKNQIENHSSKVKTNNSNFYTFVPEEEEGPAAPADC
jgi:hypothetical protein